MNLTAIKLAMDGLVGWTKTGFGDVMTRMKSQSDSMADLDVAKANMKTGRFVASQEELDLTKNAVPNQGEVFNSWYRFSHLAANWNQPASVDELGTWTYDAGTDTIQNTTNSTTYIGVVSKSRYDKYLMDVLLDSTSNDDDTIAVILAWYVDPITKREHTLSLLRSPGGNGQGSLYSIIYDYQRPDPKMFLPGNEKVTWGNGEPGSKSTTAAAFPPNVWNWSKMQENYGAPGARLRITRDGDIFTAQTTQWGSPNTIDPNTLITLDLKSDPVLEKFRGARSYGFSSQSQANSTWRVNNFTNPQDYIYDLKNNQVWEYVDDQWVIKAGATIDDLGTQQVLYNPTTKKMFYLHDPGSIVRMNTSDL